MSISLSASKLAWFRPPGACDRRPRRAAFARWTRSFRIPDNGHCLVFAAQRCQCAGCAIEVRTIAGVQHFLKFSQHAYTTEVRMLGSSWRAHCWPSPILSEARSSGTCVRFATTSLPVHCCRMLTSANTPREPPTSNSRGGCHQIWRLPGAGETSWTNSNELEAEKVLPGSRAASTAATA